MVRDLRVLAVPATHSWLVSKCKEAVKKVAEQNELHFFWAPRHAEIRGNEIAGRLASLSARSKILGPESFLGITDPG